MKRICLAKNKKIFGTKYNFAECTISGSGRWVDFWQNMHLNLNRLCDEQTEISHKYENILHQKIAWRMWVLSRHLKGQPGGQNYCFKKYAFLEPLPFWWIIFRHRFPHSWRILLVQAGLKIQNFTFLNQSTLVAWNCYMMEFFLGLSWFH